MCLLTQMFYQDKQNLIILGWKKGNQNISKNINFTDSLA